MRQTLDKVTTYTLRFIPLFLALFIPLFFLTFTADPFTFNKFYLVSFAASLSLVAWCIRSLLRGKLSFTSSPALLPLIILVLANVASSLWLSPTKHLSLFGQTTFFISLFIIFFTATSSQKTRTLIDSITIGLLLSTTILSLFTIFHYFGLVGKLISFGLLDNKLFSPTGGVFTALIFTLPVLLATIGYLLVTKDWLKKSLLFASVIFMIVACLIDISLILPQNGQQVIFLLPYGASWSIAIDIFKNWQTAFLGTGPDTYLTAFTRLRPAYLNLDPALWSIRFPESGSFFLTLTTTVGLIGSLSFLAAFLKPTLVALKHRSAHLNNPSYVFLTIILLTVLLSAFFTPSSLATLVLGVLALIALTVEFKLLGLKGVKDVSFSLAAKNEPETFYQNLSESQALNPYNFILPWVVTLLSSVLIVFYWVYAIPSYSASIQIKQAGDILAINPVGAYLKEVNAAKLDPFNSNYPLMLSQFFRSAALSLLNKKDNTPEDRKNATDYMQRAVDYGKLAVTLNPYNVIVWENLAATYQSFIGIADGASNFAVSHLAQAASLDPTNPEIRLQLGTLFFNLGDPDQALKVIGQAIELKQNWDIPYYNTALIYKSRKDYPRALQYLKAGSQYTDPKSDNYSKFQEEIKAVEKLAPTPAATQSATTK